MRRLRKRVKADIGGRNETERIMDVLCSKILAAHEKSKETDRKSVV